MQRLREQSSSPDPATARAATLLAAMTVVVGLAKDFSSASMFLT